MKKHYKITWIDTIKEEDFEEYGVDGVLRLYHLPVKAKRTGSYGTDVEFEVTFGFEIEETELKNYVESILENLGRHIDVFSVYELEPKLLFTEENM